MGCPDPLNVPSAEAVDRTVPQSRMLRDTAVRLAALCLYASAASCAGNIVSTNDDGWAVAQIRALYSDMTAAGFDVSTLLRQYRLLSS